MVMMMKIKMVITIKMKVEAGQMTEDDNQDGEHSEAYNYTDIESNHGNNNQRQNCILGKQNHHSKLF